VALFLGKHENKIDRKGRVSVPAPYRAILTARNYNGAVLFIPPDRSPVLEGGGADRLEDIQARLDQLPEFSSAYKKLQLMFNDAAELPFDTEGRIMLPPDLLHHAGLTDTALFVGGGRNFQVWSPTAYAAYRDQIHSDPAGETPGLPPLHPAGAA
jgi:MraZ protein